MTSKDKKKCGPRIESKLRDGTSDNLKEVKPLDLSKCKSVDQLVRGMGDTACAGRSVGEAADVLHAMVTDPDCFVVGTFSGAMTVAKMGLVLCDMIDNGMLNAVVSTGALMAHGFVESVGLRHFKYEPSMNDKELYYAGYDRIYDTLELEKNLDDVEELVMKALDTVDRKEILSSQSITKHLGVYLDKSIPGRGILKSAQLKNVPVYIPAFTDSELGLDVALYNRRLMKQGEKPFQFDPFIDLEHFKELVRTKKRLGIFTIGGGVPRNWAQQVGPYLDILEKRLGKGEGSFVRYQYGVRICPEPAYWGGLSGCTYSEGVSWGKFVPQSDGGRWAEVLVDATVAWPLVVKAVLERMEGGK